VVAFLLIGLFLGLKRDFLMNMNMKMSALTLLTMWSGSAMAIDTLTVGANSGNLATEQIYSEGDIAGSVFHVNESDFNSMSVADMMAYDVILIQWASDSSLDVSWDGRMGDYVYAGGGLIFDGDPNNVDDLSPLVTSGGSSCGSPWVFVDDVDGLTTGIGDEFVNCHVVYASWDTTLLSELMRDGSDQVVMLQGSHGAGRVILTGPDQDFHASKGAGGDAGNQYNFLMNEINWVSSGCLEESFYLDADGDGYGDASESVSSCEAPTGYVADATDCNDADGSVNPGAAEICDGIDNDCNGSIDLSDSSDAATWYADVDGDGYGDVSATSVACDAEAGWVADATDCDDTDPSVNPGATEYCDDIDNDCDGYIDPSDSADATTWYEDWDADGYGDPSLWYTTTACSMPDGYTSVDLATDCNDVDASINPDATEVCDGVDNDCDGEIDPSDSSDSLTWYADVDGDGYGDAAATALACDASDGWVADATDCDDEDAAVNPAATEVCDGVDNDCDGELDPSDSSDSLTWYADVDGDGYGDASATALACVGADGWVADATDCDDTDPAVNPGAAEVCNDIDDDCDGVVDPDDAVDSATWYADADGDGFGDAESSMMGCIGMDGYVADDMDCDDMDAAVNPDAAEVCDGIDNDCSGDIDGADAEDAIVLYEDNDGDGFGMESFEEICVEDESACDSGMMDTGCVEETCDMVSTAVMTCEELDGYVEDNTDCDDEDADVYPGAPGMDDECVELEDTGSADDTGIMDDTGDEGDSDDTGVVSGGDDDADADGGDEGDTGGDADKPETDCGCATGTLSGSSPWLAVLGLMALVRRRQD
jgi:hypothetical protein